MKLAKSLFLGLCVLGFAVTAQSQTVIRLTGSTAYRSQTHAAIQAIMTDEAVAHTGSALSGAASSIFNGTVDSNAVIIKCYWTGSVAGVRDVAGGLTINVVESSGPNYAGFLADGTLGAANTITANVATGTQSNFEPGVADIAMSDTYQGSTLFSSPTLVGDDDVGIIPFRFFATTGAPFTNVSAEQIVQLYAAGDLPLSFFTGLPADHTKKVYAIGRDNLSGTRLTAAAISGIGVFSSVNQYDATAGISGATITALAGPGNGGVSGGSLATWTRKTLAGGLAGSYLLGYMGGSDATAALAVADGNGSPAVELTYNGWGFTNANVQEGKYTFWGYQHLLYPSGLSGVKQAVANTLANQIQTADSVRSGMQVSRPTDGGVISPLF